MSIFVENFAPHGYYPERSGNKLPLGAVEQLRREQFSCTSWWKP